MLFEANDDGTRTLQAASANSKPARGEEVSTFFTHDSFAKKMCVSRPNLFVFSMGYFKHPSQKRGRQSSSEGKHCMKIAKLPAADSQVDKKAININPTGFRSIVRSHRCTQFVKRLGFPYLSEARRFESRKISFSGQYDNTSKKRTY